MAQSSTKDTQRGGDGDADGERQLELRLTDWLTDADTRWPHKMQHAKGAQLTAAKDKHKRFHCPPSLSLSLSLTLSVHQTPCNHCNFFLFLPRQQQQQEQRQSCRLLFSAAVAN